MDASCTLPLQIIVVEGYHKGMHALHAVKQQLYMTHDCFAVEDAANAFAGSHICSGRYSSPVSLLADVASSKCSAFVANSTAKQTYRRTPLQHTPNVAAFIAGVWFEMVARRQGDRQRWQ